MCVFVVKKKKKTLKEFFTFRVFSEVHIITATLNR